MPERRIGSSADVVWWNLHNERAAAKHLRNLDFDLGGYCEGQRRTFTLRGAPQHTLLTGTKGRPDNMRQETGLLMPDGHEIRGQTVEKFSDTVKAEALYRVGKERHGHTGVMTLLGVETAIIAAHPVAGASLAGHDPDTQIVRAYRDFVDWLREQFRYQIKHRGRAVILLSDIQMRENASRPWSPHRVLRDYGVSTFWDGIDVIGWTGEFKAAHTEARRAGLPSDHPLMRVRLRRS